MCLKLCNKIPCLSSLLLRVAFKLCYPVVILVKSWTQKSTKFCILRFCFQTQECWQSSSTRKAANARTGKSSLLCVVLYSFCSMVRFFTLIEMLSERLDDSRLVKSCGPGKDGIEIPSTNRHPATGRFPMFKTMTNLFTARKSNESIADSKTKLIRGGHNIAMTLSNTLHACNPALPSWVSPVEGPFMLFSHKLFTCRRRMRIQIFFRIVISKILYAAAKLIL